MSLLQKIRDKFIISEYISQYVRLKKNGNQYLGLCPFHHEKNPSFTVDNTKGMFYCFGCKVGGDVIKFESEYQKKTYGEVVRDLAKKLGLELDSRNSQYSIINKLDCDKETNQKSNANLYSIHALIAKFYSKCLFMEDGLSQIALQYIQNRGISNEIIELYKLGYSSGKIKQMKLFFIENKFSEILINKARIIYKNSKGEEEDKFKERIIFPICDKDGRVIGFGGRVIDNASQSPKYINSTETELFKKRNTLYGLHIALQYIRSRDHDVFPRFLIVEGYIDVIKLANIGIKSAVAVLGTAIRVDHIIQLAKYSDHAPIVCLDSDTAGMRAMVKLAYEMLDNLLNETGSSLRIEFFLIEDAKDMDELADKMTKGEIIKLINEKKVTLSKIIFDDLLKQSAEIGSKSEKIKNMKSSIKKITDGRKDKTFSKEFFYEINDMIYNWARSNTEAKKSSVSKYNNSDLIKKRISKGVSKCIKKELNYLPLISDVVRKCILSSIKFPESAFPPNELSITSISELEIQIHHVRNNTLRYEILKPSMEASELNKIETINVELYKNIAHALALIVQSISLDNTFIVDFSSGKYGLQSNDIIEILDILYGEFQDELKMLEHTNFDAFWNAQPFSNIQTSSSSEYVKLPKYAIKPYPCR